MAATQKALLIPAKSEPFTLGTRPIPTPGPGQILVKIVATALNPVDYYMGTFGMFVPGYPAVLGCDGAGTVEVLGAGAESAGRTKGERVLFQNIQLTAEPADYGTFQQFALVDAKRVYKIPPSLSFESAATIPLGLATAALGLYGQRGPRGGVALTPPWVDGGLGKYKDQPALVIGGSSSVGQFALQFLRLSGFNPILTTASAHNEAYARAAGATHVVDYRSTPYAALPAAAAALAGTDALPLVYDAIGTEETQRAGWALVAPRGALVVVRDPVVAPDAGDTRHVAYVWGAVDELDKHAHGRAWADAMYAAVARYLASGQIQPNRWEKAEGGLGAVPAALEKVGALRSRGAKVVVRVDETP